MKPIASFISGILLLLVTVSTSGVWAQTPKSPCADKNYHLFDFWIGEWEVFANGTLAGENSIKPILDGCALQETWTGAAGSKGTSLNYYNPSTGKWHQFWIWQNGTTLPLLTGEFADGKMTLSGEAKGKDGQMVKMRITWHDNPDGTVRQHWQASKDGGATWTTQFDGTYKRKP